jgi:ribonuclease HII
MAKCAIPGLNEEQELWCKGHQVVVGLDEVGKGAWAGPLTVGAVVIPKDRRIYKIRDSKMIPETKREVIYDRVVDWCDAWAVGHASNQECDELGMSDAQRLAAKRALLALGVEPHALLLDGKWNFVSHLPNVKTIVKGDSKSLSIAAASIVAKVTRDRIMRRQAAGFPDYDFVHNKGYPSPKHRSALHQFGPTLLHRVSWAFMNRLSS